MLNLLKNVDLYAPQPRGLRDLLLCAGKIEAVLPPDGFDRPCPRMEIHDCTGLRALPGLVDQHVHILGGGGEEGFASRAPRLEAAALAGAGVTTAVGLLGADGCTRSLLDLYAHAKALEAAGITTYLYAGSYAVPPVTFTGSLLRDLVLIDKVVGAGEIALSDHRSSQCGEAGGSFAALLRLAADTHLGGLLAGKAGVVHLHVGDGKGGLATLRALLEKSDLPRGMFVPTHLNRNPSLFGEAVQYALEGGNTDLTAGETAGLAVPEAVKKLLEAGAPAGHITVSSDAGGSIPGGGIAPVQALYDDLAGCIRAGIPAEQAIAFATENPAKLLHLWPRKGAIAEGADADLLLADREWRIQAVYGGGRLLAGALPDGTQNAES